MTSSRGRTLGLGLFLNMLWHASGMAGRLFTYVVALAILARMAGPETMGVYGIVWAVLALLFALLQNGIAQSLILVNDLRQETIAAAYAMTLMLAALAAVGVFLLGTPVAEIYGKPELVAAFRSASPFALLMALGAVDIAIAQRELDFRTIAWVQTASAVASAVVALSLALWLSPLIGLLALQGVVGPVQFTLFRLSRRGRAFKLKFAISDLLEIWGPGKHLALNTFTGSALVNLPALLVAGSLSTDQVGIFTLCRRIIEIINNQIGGLAYQVLFPSFASIRDQKVEMANAFLVVSRVSAILVMVPLVALAISPTSFLFLYAGPHWAAGGTVLLQLVLMQAGYALAQSVFAVLQSIGSAHVVWRWNIFMMLWQTLLLYLLGFDTAFDVATALAISSTAMPLATLILQRKLEFSLLEWLVNMLRVFVPAALFVGVATVLPLSNAENTAGTLLYLALTSGLGVFAYLSLMVVLEPLSRNFILGKLRGCK